MDTDIQLNGKFKNVNITPKYYPYKIKKKNYIFSTERFICYLKLLLYMKNFI